jgi:hypothetical protein
MPPRAKIKSLPCPVKGCNKSFKGKTPRKSLLRHLKYTATQKHKNKDLTEEEKGDLERLIHNHHVAHNRAKIDKKPGKYIQSLIKKIKS